MKISEKTTTASVPVTQRTDSEKSVKVCEYGLDSCGEHQECYLPKNSLKRSGICVCVEGYYMGTNNECVLSPSSTAVSTYSHRNVNVIPVL